MTCDANSKNIITQRGDLLARGAIAYLYTIRQGGEHSRMFEDERLDDVTTCPRRTAGYWTAKKRHVQILKKRE